METWPSPAIPTLPGHAPAIRLHDVESSRPTPLAVGDVARMYVCGITPYDATHLGHAFTYITFDLLNRVWRDAGHDVEYVQNVTDIDDPLLERAVATGQDWRELADRETALFRADMAALRVLPPTHYVGAVESMHLVASAVSALSGRGAVYQVDEDLYFDLSADDRFGGVARLGTPEMLSLCAERGGDPQRAGKRHPLDPLLWQAARPDEPAWDTPLGHGRPGWHIECTAIALEHLGMAFDVQGGGSDLAYPHHEMCASLAHVATGRWPFARRYVHAAMVGLGGHKMSKSRGNLVFVSRLLGAGWPAPAVRLALLEHHYRTDWEWEDGALDTATARYERWTQATRAAVGPTAQAVLDEVRAALADDLDAPRALRVIDRWAERVRRGHGDDPTAPHMVADVVDALLGVDLRTPAVSRPGPGV